MQKSVIFVALTCLLASSVAFAAKVPLKPGLWEITVKMKTADGKESDPQAQLAEAMKNMPPEQRQQMAKMMGKAGVAPAASGHGMRVCYSKEMLAHPESLTNDGKEQSQCTTRVTKKSSSLSEISFDCKDGTSGKGEWTFDGNKAYRSHMSFTSKDGKRSEMNQQGKFISANCGNVKPLLGDKS